MAHNYDKNINKTSKISKLTKIKNPRKHLVYTDFLMIFLSIFIGLYLTSSKSASWMVSSFEVLPPACCCPLNGLPCPG